MVKSWIQAVVKTGTDDGNIFGGQNKENHMQSWKAEAENAILDRVD